MKLQQFNVELLRLPVKHCTLNPIQLALAGLKQHVRKYNTSFVSYVKLTLTVSLILEQDVRFLIKNCTSLQTPSDVHVLVQEFIDAVDYSISHNYVEHVRKVEEVSRVANALVEEDIECNIIDSESDPDQDTEEDMCGDDDADDDA